MAAERTRALAGTGHRRGRARAEALSFGDTLERLLEILLVVLVGVAVAVHCDPRAIPVALVLLLLRPPLARSALA